MKRLNIFFLTIIAGLVLLGGVAQAANQQWQGNASQRKGAAPVATDKNIPQRFDLQCPTAYAGIKGELLPTYWEPIDKAQTVELIKSQVLNQYFYCVYRIPSSGRDIHSSIRKLLPEGYNCLSDGAGRFECRAKGR
ncbi:hypothetical protein [Geopsychrobacter electrodiphilus]|uniref:hypothetical protein n=1 Tax=Geopsychrobacter electrodiphilus TaxID=225196 RepID=UPI0003630F54|nr:hypothetical protein [Geopsychrobacter electrodiphilus]